MVKGYEKISLRPRNLDNVKVFWEKSKDEELGKLFPFLNNSLNEVIKLYEESIQPGARSFGQVIYADEEYIGDVWCYGIDEIEEKSAFISIVIFNKNFWGQGIGKEILMQFSKVIFENYSINKLCAFTYKSNTRSIAALEKAGFVKLEDFEEAGVASCYFERVK